MHGGMLKKSIIKQAPQIKIADLTSNEKLSNILESIEDKIMHEIQQNNLKVSPEKIDFSEIQSKKIKTKQEHQEQNKLDAIQKLKQSIQSKLSELQKEEQSILSHQHVRQHRRQKTHQNEFLLNQNEVLEDHESQLSYVRDNYSTYTRSHPKSEFSKEEKRKIIKQKIRIEQFQLKLQQKTKHYEEYLMKIKLEEFEMQQKYILGINEKNKQKILLRQAEINKQKQQKSKELSLEKQRLIKLKNNKKLYLELEKIYKTVQAKQAQEKQDLFKRRQKTAKQQNSITNITHHQQNYQHYIELKRKQRLHKLKYIRQMSENLAEQESRLIVKSKYYKSILKEEQEVHEKQKIIELEKQEKIQKIKNYALKLKRFRPTSINIRQRTEFIEEKTNQRRKSLSREELKQRGDTYMKEILSHLSKEAKQKTQIGDFNPEVEKKQKDYIEEMRNKRLENQKNQIKKILHRNKYSGQLVRMRKIMKSNDPEHIKIAKVKLIANRVDNDPFSKKDEHLIDKIEAKLQILAVTGQKN